MSRKVFICGNWKMNTRIKEGLDLAGEIAGGIKSPSLDVVLAPPFTHLHPISKKLASSEIALSAQDMSSEEMGAHTGEVSSEMLLDLGVRYVILGHSEARARGQSDELVAKKIRRALDQGLVPIVCVGEEESIKEEGRTEDFVLSQVARALEGLDQEEVSNLIIAYEPIWAIGTGKTASAEDAQFMAASIRNMLRDRYSKVAQRVRILYGGSAKASNAQAILEKQDVDGLLVGGASLKAGEFLQMIQIGEKNV